MTIEGLIFVVIAGLISLAFKKIENNKPSKANPQQVDPEENKPDGWLENGGPSVSPVKIKHQTKSAARVEKEKSVDVSKPVKKQKKEPLSVIETWTREDMVKGIVLSEILGPPKSKRKK